MRNSCFKGTIIFITVSFIDASRKIAREFWNFLVYFKSSLKASQIPWQFYECCFSIAFTIQISCVSLLISFLPQPKIPNPSTTILSFSLDHPLWFGQSFQTLSQSYILTGTLYAFSLIHLTLHLLTTPLSYYPLILFGHHRHQPLSTICQMGCYFFACFRAFICK